MKTRKPSTRGGPQGPESGVASSADALASNQDAIEDSGVERVDFDVPWDYSGSTSILGMLSAQVRIRGTRAGAADRDNLDMDTMLGPMSMPSIAAVVEDGDFASLVDQTNRDGLQKAVAHAKGEPEVADAEASVALELYEEAAEWLDVQIDDVEITDLAYAELRRRQQGNRLLVNRDGLADVEVTTPWGHQVRVAGLADVFVTKHRKAEVGEDNILGALERGLNRAVFEQVSQGRDDRTADRRAMDAVVRQQSSALNRRGVTISRIDNVEIEDGSGKPYSVQAYKRALLGRKEGASGSITASARKHEVALEDDDNASKTRMGNLSSRLVEVMAEHPEMSAREASEYVQRAGLQFDEPHAVDRTEFGEEEQDAELTGRKVAICMGNDRYNKVSSLKGCVNDANALAGAMASRGYEPFVRTDLSGKQIQTLLTWAMKQLGPGDALFLSYSGHGTQKGANAGLLGVDSAVVPHAYVLQVLARLSAKGVQTDSVIDACYSGQLTTLANAAQEKALGTGAKDADLGDQLAAIATELGALADLVSGHETGAKAHHATSRVHKPQVDGPEQHYDPVVAARVSHGVSGLAALYSELTQEQLEGVDDLQFVSFREAQTRLREWRLQVHAHLRTLQA